MTGAEKIVNAMKQVNKSNKSTPSEIVSATVIGVNPLIFQLENRLQIDNKFYELSNLTDWSKVQIGQVFRALSFNEGQKYYILEEYPLKASTNSAKMDERISTNRTDINNLTNTVSVISENITYLDSNKQDKLIPSDNITIDENNNIDVNIANLNKYSVSEETVVGTWIDGKPIYRKVITISSWPKATQVNMDIPDILNVETIITCTGALRNTVEFFHTQYYNSTNFDSVLAMISGTIIYAIRLKTNSDRRGYSGFVVLEYTKTTD